MSSQILETDLVSSVNLNVLFFGKDGTQHLWLGPYLRYVVLCHIVNMICQSYDHVGVFSYQSHIGIFSLGALICLFQAP